MKTILYLSLAGLILGLLGAIILSSSTKIISLENYNGVTIKMVGMPATITQINQSLFKGGLILMALGFILQAIPIIIQIFKG